MNLRKSFCAFFVLFFISILFSQVSWAYAEGSTDAPISSPISTPISTPITTIFHQDSPLSPAGGSSPAPVCNSIKPKSAPKLISIKQTGSNQATLTWEKAQGQVTYYMISYGLSKGTKMFGNPNVGGDNTTSYTVSHLSGNTTYYFRVRAGNGCMPGDFSEEMAIKISGPKLSGNAGNFDSFILATTKSYKNENIPSLNQKIINGKSIILENMPKTSPSERIFKSFNNMKNRITGFFTSLLPH